MFYPFLFFLVYLIIIGEVKDGIGTMVANIFLENFVQIDKLELSIH